MSNPLVYCVSIADALTPIQRQRVIDLCSAAYELDFGTLFQDLPGSAHVLAFHNDLLVSHAAWVTRWLQPGESDVGPPLRTAYVEAVATAPQHQGKGYASATMRHLATQVQAYDLAALSPSDPAFYRRFGWELWLGPLAIRTEQALLPTPDEQVMILRLPRTPNLDLNQPLMAEWRPGELW